MLIKRNPIVHTLLLLILLSSCIKTRSQLRGEESDASGTAPYPAQQNQLVDDLRSEITRLSARLEDLERNQKQLQSDSKSHGEEEQKKLEKRILELEEAQLHMLENLKKPEQNPVSNIDPEDLFLTAKKKLKQGQFAESTKLFSAYLQTSKPSEEVEATFLLGESHFGSKQYSKAILEYDKISKKKGGQSSFIPKALYKIGLSFENLGNHDDAQSFFEEILDKYPKSKEAPLAKARLSGGKKSKKSKKK